MDRDFSEFFRRATGREPYPYQALLAERQVWTELLHVPTGAGKTAAVVLAWLWRRRFHPNLEVRAATPRRLIYCLPMRVLVEQTQGVVKGFLERLGLMGGNSEAGGGDLQQEQAGAGVDVHVFLGGEVATDWVLYPEREAVIIGTQDMLLSRALNRGYAASRYRWPREFSLLNNDALWVMDEIQLMGVGLATTAQLMAFRHQFGTYGKTNSLWMSATLNLDWFHMADFTPPGEEKRLSLSADDKRHPALARIWQAKKVLRHCSEIAVGDKDYAGKLAEFALARHVEARQAREGAGTTASGPLTLIIVNTVRRAQEVFREIEEQVEGKRRPRSFDGENRPELLLLHSRFRPYERERLVEKLSETLGPSGRILVATQAVEAGVDISAVTLITELAPWSSLVQRFGRCNRRGEEETATVWLVPIPFSTRAKKENPVAPYLPEELKEAEEKLQGLTAVGLADLAGVEVSAGQSDFSVLRRRDLLDLFDTTPDLSGQDIDVARFVRNSEDRDLQVFWREWPEAVEEKPPQATDFPSAQREELCPVSLSDFRAFLKERATRLAWVWDHLTGEWVNVRQEQIRPGLTILLAAQAGGYSHLGWDPGSQDLVTPVPLPQGKEINPETLAEEETFERDPLSELDQWQTLAEHTDRVVNIAAQMPLQNLGIAAEEAQALLQAARYHDAGKSHPVFQDTLRQSNPGDPHTQSNSIWAKAPRGQRQRHKRPYFRHELASALAYLQSPVAYAQLPPGWRDLVPYLIAAHHGKVRLTIRPMPGEKPEEKGSANGKSEVTTPVTRYALGIWEGDPLPDPALGTTVDLGGGTVLGPLRLTLAPMEFGFAQSEEPSWQERMLRLLEDERFGPFRLAYLEALLAAADARGSKEAREKKGGE